MRISMQTPLNGAMQLQLVNYHKLHLPNINCSNNDVRGTAGKLSLGHDRGMVMGDLPLTVLELVDEGITGLDLVAEEVELVDAGILAPVGTDNDVGLEDGALGLLLKEVDEIILDGIIVSAGNVR